MRSVVIVILFFVAPFFCEAQGEFNIWYFGQHAGIDFNSGSPIAIQGPDFTGEGTAIMCDAAGNLLFYSDRSEERV